MNYSSLKVGTLTGTLLSVLATITWYDIEKTMVLGSIGATVSFLVSFLLKKIIEYGKDHLGSSIKRRPKS